MKLRNSPFAWAMFLVASIAAAADPVAPRADLYGDSLPEGAALRLGTVRWRGENSNMSIAYCPDGKTLVTAGGPVCLWNTATGTMVRQMQCRYGTVYSIAVSPDGKTIVPCGTTAAASTEIDVRLWDTETGREIRQLVGHTNMVFAAAFSPDGRTLASASEDRTLRLWDLATGKSIRQFNGHDDAVWAVGFTPDGKLLASAGKDGTARIWDVATAKELHRFVGPPGDIRSIALSQDGKLLAWCCQDQVLRLADPTTGREVRRIAKPGGLRVAFSPDGKVLATGDYGTPIRLWDAAAGMQIRELMRGPGALGFAFSPDGTTVAAVGLESAIRRWTVATGQPLSFGEGHAGEVSAVAFSADGQTVVSASSDGTVRRWEAATGKPAGQFEIVRHHLWMSNPVALTQDARLIAMPGPRVWEVATGLALPAFADPKAQDGCVAFSADGKTLAATGNPSSLRNAATGKEFAKGVHAVGHEIVALAVSRDSNLFAEAINHVAMREYGWINLQDLSSTKTRRLGGEGRFMHYYCLAFSPDGKLLASSSAGNNAGGIVLWDATTGAETRKLYQYCATCMVFSPDGRILATARGSSIHFWDVGTGESCGEIKGPNSNIACLAFSPNGARLASGCGNTTISIWPIDASIRQKR